MQFEDYEVLGRKAYAEKRYEDAVRYFTKALAIRQDKALLYLDGMARYRLQNYDEAIISYTKALELDEKLRDAWEAKGDALVQIWKFREAVKCYERALALRYDPELEKKINQLKSIWNY